MERYLLPTRYCGRLGTLRYDQYDRDKSNTTVVRLEERTNSSVATYRISPHLKLLSYDTLSKVA